MRPATLAVTFSAAALMTWCCATHGPLKPNVSADARRDAIRRAQVWEKTDIRAMDMKAGPPGHGAFDAGTARRLPLRPKQMSGNSPKFTCVIPPDDEVKVKFGRDNGEVYAEVAATPAVLGARFPGRSHVPGEGPLRGLPAEPRMPRRQERRADPVRSGVNRAQVQRARADRRRARGWAWPELDDVQETAGGAPMAQRDALKLLAVFVQHTDNKARAAAVDLRRSERGRGAARCEHPVMMVNDLGQTFGRSNLFNRDAVGSVNLDEWTAAQVWSDPKRCIGDLPPSQTGTSQNPADQRVGPEVSVGPAEQLTDQQLHDLFEVARFEDRTERMAKPRAHDRRVGERVQEKAGRDRELDLPLVDDAGGRPAYLMNVPARSSLIACRSSACVFITIGPYHATGSSSGLPETSRKRMPSSPAWTTISSPRSNRTSDRLPVSLARHRVAAVGRSR